MLRALLLLLCLALSTSVAVPARRTRRWCEVCEATHWSSAWYICGGPILGLRRRKVSKAAVCAAVYQAGRRLAQRLELDSGFRLWHWLLNEDRLSARDLKTGARLVYSGARPDVQALRLGFEALNNHVKDKSVLFAFCGTSIIEQHNTCPCAHDLCARDW